MSGEATYKAHELLEKGRPVVVATIVGTQGSSPRHAGSFMVFDQKGRHWGSVGGGLVEATVCERAAEAFKTRERSRVHHFTLHDDGSAGALDMACGGDADIRIEYFTPETADQLDLPTPRTDTAVIFGCGHVGAAIEPIARSVGFRTVMVDDRAEYADPALFPQADEVVVLDSFDEALSRVPVDDASYLVIVTRGHKGDAAVLRQALSAPHAYIGMIGSRRKTAAVFELMREAGFDDAQLGRVYAPIGEAIGAETPEEIAVSIVGELIRVRSGNGTR